MKHTFFGGVHPPYKKEMSLHDADLLSLAPDQVVIPLKQHIGAPCTPLVKVGDSVLRGQKIGDGDDLCVPIHASVSGKVVAIEPRLHPNGDMVDAIVIENDNKDDSVSFIGCDLPIDEIDEDALLHAIREAGIVGMGGAAFPSNVKAISAMGKVDTLIANACECEPYITADDMLLRIEPEHVLEGMMLLHRIFDAQRIVIGIEDNKPLAIERLRALRAHYPQIEIVVLPTRYPQGSEKQLIQAITGRQIPPNGLPFHVNCVVFNISTIAAIYRAVREGKPLTERIVTVSGEALKKPQNLLVRIGTSFDDVIKAAGGLSSDADRVLAGGPMMGTAQRDLTAPIIKATNAILCLKEDPDTMVEDPICIRCGKCIKACPMHLQPIYIARYLAAGRVSELVRLNVTDCLECGSCAFACPGKLPLTDDCRIAKKLVKEVSAK